MSNKNKLFKKMQKHEASIHSIHINKNINKNIADEVVRYILNFKKINKVPSVKVVGDIIQYKVIPKTKFIGRSCHTYKINKNISVVFGKIKDEHKGHKHHSRLTGGAWWNDLWEGIKDVGSSVWNTVKDGATDLWDAVKGKANDVAQSVNDSVHEFLKPDTPEPAPYIVEDHVDLSQPPPVALPTPVMPDIASLSAKLKEMIPVAPPVEAIAPMALHNVDINSAPYQHLPKSYFEPGSFKTADLTHEFAIKPRDIDTEPKSSKDNKTPSEST